MKNINKIFKAFSLAEMLVVMLILTIVLAASMPIISKRAKAKSAGTGTAGSLTCMTVVDSYLSTTIPADVKSMSYIMYGGGGGGGSSDSWNQECGTGGGGGSSAIVISGLTPVVAHGGDGGYNESSGKNAGSASGTLSNVASRTLTVYAGGGGGGGGWIKAGSGWPSQGGGGGAGY